MLFDLGSVHCDYADGVSEVNSTVGLDREETMQIVYLSGLCPAVVGFEINEYNPAVEKFRTGTLVAQMFYELLMGIGSRIDKNTIQKTIN